MLFRSHLATATLARETLWAMRRRSEVRDEARRVFDKHGSRNPAREGRARSKRKPATESTAETPQLSLGLE